MAKKQTEEQKDSRARVWTLINYPESAPADWKDKLNSKHIAWCYILHDKDINPDGTDKKHHHHIVLVFEGKKSFTQIKELADSIGARVPQKVDSMRGMIRYLIHMDNPEKYQYQKDDIQAFGGLDYEDYLKSMGTARRSVLKDIAKYIVDEGVVGYDDLTMTAIERGDDWFDAVSTNTIFFGRLCDDVWKKQNRAERTNYKFEADKMDTLQQTRKMAEKGVKRAVIADTLGISERTVRRYLAK